MSKYQAKSNHQEFLTVTGNLKAKNGDDGEIFDDMFYSLTGKQLKIILGHAKWLQSWLKHFSEAGKSQHPNKGIHRRKPIDQISDYAVLKRMYRAAKKEHPHLTFQEFCKRPNVEKFVAGRSHYQMSKARKA